MRIAILGSTGQAGRRIAAYLAGQGLYDLVLIGRSAEKLNALRGELSPIPPRTITIELANIASSRDLARVFQKVDLAVIAISAPAQLPPIVQAALETGTDCLDILLCSPEKRAFLEAQSRTFERQNICYITGGGTHPGLPAALVRYAETLCPGLRQANVFGSFNVNWKTHDTAPETMVDFLEEIRAMDTSAFVDGAWGCSWRNTRPHLFPPPAGEQKCTAMGLDEMTALPALIPTLQDTGFYIGGLTPWIDRALLPTALAALNAFPKAAPFIGRLFGLALRYLSPRQEWSMMELIGSSGREKISILLSYSDAYHLTAIPVVACIDYYANHPKRAGLFQQALFVEPTHFFADLQKMGVMLKSRIEPVQ